MADFRDTRNILNRKPRIAFVEPDQVPEESQPIETAPDTDNLLTRMQTVKEQYARIEKLSEIAQKRIDDRSKTAKVCLDPVQDAKVIAAIKRHFGTDSTCITYEQYKECLVKLSKAGQEVAPYNTAEQMRVAIQDPFRKDLGGSGGTPGSLRPELQITSPVQPIDLTKFQKESLIALFGMMFPLINGLDDFKLAAHTASLPGHFK